ncbi:wd-40 repeat-containing protein [Stylonychia lemnae]|uniref:Wd-40 repeat-containing protein n=1 Tax=Stylonychia lemnae TaxID=5949 RepID=A0A078B621_STYLE|nr:wd-40 repeat-containing protein [Stylonychia lemnae]|eukprot:CDW89960.1 wd-40 repeat-containing protein [Stylonychia lemnae]
MHSPGPLLLLNGCLPAMCKYQSTLTCFRPQGSDSSTQKLLIGTHTSNDEQNYIQIMKVKIPLESSKDTRDYQDNARDVNGIGGSSHKNERIQIETQINHQGEVNKARYMPQSHNIIASKTISGEVHIFDFFKHPSKPSNDQVKPDLKLLGHKKEGFGLAWNPVHGGMLLSGSDDSLICIWDVNKPNQLNNSIEPLHTYEAHTQVVEDVAWNYFDGNLFASVSDDKRLILWDLRERQPAQNIEAHMAEIMSVDYSPFDSNLLVTGSADGSVAVWDTRNIKSKLFSLRHHKDEVTQVKFSPMLGNLLASSGADRRVMVWDLSRIGQKQTEEEKRDGPPELLFIHGGMTAKVSDIAWNLNEKLMMASCAEDNILQVWQIAYEIYYDQNQL